MFALRLGFSQWGAVIKFSWCFQTGPFFKSNYERKHAAVLQLSVPLTVKAVARRLQHHLPSQHPADWRRLTKYNEDWRRPETTRRTSGTFTAAMRDFTSNSSQGRTNMTCCRFCVFFFTAFFIIAERTACEDIHTHLHAHTHTNTSRL